MIIEALELARNFIKFNTGSSHYVIEQLDQAIADFEKQEPVAWPCVISEADFEKNTVILEMKCNDYQIKSGQHWLSPHPQPKQEPVAWIHKQTGVITKEWSFDKDLFEPLYTHPKTNSEFVGVLETLLSALENEQDRNRLEDVCVDATDAAVLLGRQYLGLLNKQINSDLKKSECWCHSCNRDVLVNGFPFALTRMILCPDCGNKRCPKANNHTFACTNSNEPNQVGSAYNFGPK